MKNNENIINIAVILICIFFIAIVPLKYTVPVDLQNADDSLGLITSFSARVVNNWLTDGITNDRFVMYQDFPSVEFEGNNKRSVYLSYPPGSLVPLYFMARITGQKEVSIGLIKYFVQIEYYLAIFLLGFFFYVCLRFLKIKSRLFIIVLPVILSVLWAFLPYNVYYMNNVYFADEAVILLSIVFFLIEILWYQEKFKKYSVPLQILSCFVLFIGLLTDYYFFFIAFITMGLRMIKNFQEHPEKLFIHKLFFNTWPFIITIITAVALFCIQVSSIPNGLKFLALTFSIRSGSGDEWGGLKVLINNFGNGFTVLSIPVLLAVSIFCVLFPFIRKHYSQNKQMFVYWLSMIVLSTALHTAIFMEHSIVHEFSMLKYNLVFVFIIFALIYWIYIYFETAAMDKIKKYSNVLIMFLFCFFAYLYVNLKDYDESFYNIRIYAIDHSIAEFVRNNTDYYDVVYSPDYEIDCEPASSRELLISRKRIYSVSKLDEIPLASLPGYAVVNLLISEDTIRNRSWDKLWTQNGVTKKFGNIYLFKFSKESFQTLMNTNG